VEVEKLRVVAVDVVISLNVRWRPWGLLCCVWRLPIFSRDQSCAFKNKTTWTCRKIRITRCEKSRFYPV